MEVLTYPSIINKLSNPENYGVPTLNLGSKVEDFIKLTELGSRIIFSVRNICIHWLNATAVNSTQKISIYLPFVY